MRLTAGLMLDRSKLLRELKGRGLTPQQQDAVLARRNFIAAAPLFLLQAHAALQRPVFNANASPSHPGTSGDMYTWTLASDHCIVRADADGLRGKCRSDVREVSCAQPPRNPSRDWQLPAPEPGRGALSASCSSPVAERVGKRKAISEADRLAQAANERGTLAREQQQRTKELVDSMWQSLE
jgi:hypothetical protein